MKVLIVHPCKGFYGGAEEVVVQLSTYLYRQGHTVLVITKDTPREMGEKIPAGINTNGWWEFRKRVREHMEGADVINVHNFPATLIPFPTKKPIVYMCNEPAELFTNWWRKPIEAFNRWWVKRSGMKVVVTDKLNADRFGTIYRVEPKIIPYGVDYSFWSGVNGVKKEDRFTLLQVGHSEFFGVGQRVLEEVRKEIPEAQLVQLIGRTHGEVREWYGRAHVLIHPIGNQGGWLVPFEALCAGLLIIVSREFTGVDTIMENRLGLVAVNEASFVAHIVEAHNGYGRLREFTDGARQWVKGNLTWEKFGEGIVKVFKEALN